MGPPSVCRSPWLLSQWWQNQDSNHILAPPTASPALSKWGWRADPSPLWTYLRPLWSQVFTSAFPGLSSLPQCMGLRSVRHGMLAMGSFQVCWTVAGCLEAHCWLGYLPKMRHLFYPNSEGVDHGGLLLSHLPPLRSCIAALNEHCHLWLTKLSTLSLHPLPAPMLLPWAGRGQAVLSDPCHWAPPHDWL